MSRGDTLGIFLGGGGSRAAYQAGVLRYLARRWPDLELPIITGVSSGAINATLLANSRHPFDQAVRHLSMCWESLSSDQVYRSDPFSIGLAALRIGIRMFSGGARTAPLPKGLLNTSPLRDFLAKALGAPDGGLNGVAQNIEDGRLHALALTTTHYASGRTITWVQGRSFEVWRRAQRESIPTRITLDHVMASTALPIMFPAVSIGGMWHGDGAIRQVAPLSPALHLGAQRILTVSTSGPEPPDAGPVARQEEYPSPVQVIGVLLNAVFLDMLDYDATNLRRISALSESLPAEDRLGLRTAELLAIRPSRDLAELAVEHEWQLPKLVRNLLRGLGVRDQSGMDFLSMVLFEPVYIRRLLDLGEKDAEAQEEPLKTFLFG